MAGRARVERGLGMGLRTSLPVLSVALAATGIATPQLAIARGPVAGHRAAIPT